jgi:hypothetical protein
MSKLTLTANPGFVFNDLEESTLDSYEFSVNVKLNISAITNLNGVKITEEDVAEFNTNGTITELNFPIIQKLFKFDPTITLLQAQESFTAKATPSKGNMSKLTLTANPGFTFNNYFDKILHSSNFLVSKKLVITLSDLTGLKITDEDIAKFNTAGTITDLNFPIIKKLFKLPAEMELLQAQESFTARITTTTGNMSKLTLTANPGFVFIYLIQK